MASKLLNSLFFLLLGMGLWFLGHYLYMKWKAHHFEKKLRPNPKPMTDREAAIFLFGLLDDIDTVSDIAKSNDKAYRRMVEKIQNRRWECGMTTDGYKVYMPGEEPKKPKLEMTEPEMIEVPNEQPLTPFNLGDKITSMKTATEGRKDEV